MPGSLTDGLDVAASSCSDRRRCCQERRPRRQSPPQPPVRPSPLARVSAVIVHQPHMRAGKGKSGPGIPSTTSRRRLAFLSSRPIEWKSALRRAVPPARNSRVGGSEALSTTTSWLTRLRDSSPRYSFEQVLDASRDRPTAAAVTPDAQVLKPIKPINTHPGGLVLFRRPYLREEGTMSPRALSSRTGCRAAP